MPVGLGMCLASRYARHMDENLLAAARQAQEQLVEADHAAEVAKAQFHRAVRRLHLSGASLRELAAALQLSHQRVHQIVRTAGATGWAPPLPSTCRHSGWSVSPPACTRSCPSLSRAQPSRRSSPTPPTTRRLDGLGAAGTRLAHIPLAWSSVTPLTRARRPAADLRRRGAGRRLDHPAGASSAGSVSLE